jgi:hypothetical protein
MRIKDLVNLEFAHIKDILETTAHSSHRHDESWHVRLQERGEW